jgi:tetratricopeptide (TPR) repeat protein
MKKLALSIAATGLVAFAAAQGPSSNRVDAIWDAASDRISQQIDVWFQDGDFPVVVSLLGVQYELDTANYDVATNLGWMQENIQQWDDALATYVRYRELNPTDPDRALPEAEFYFRQKAYAKIPALLEPVLTMKHHPHPNVFRILAHAYEKQHLYVDAKRIYLAYIGIAPDDLTAKVNLARVEKKLAAGS